MSQALPSYARLHELFEYRDGQLIRKRNGKVAGHHHVLNSKNMVVVEKNDKRYVAVVNEGTITHQKEHSRHPDLPLPVGNYQIKIKTEYDIFNDVISAVQD
jgi:hypothetical protein